MLIWRVLFYIFFYSAIYNTLKNISLHGEQKLFIKAAVFLEITRLRDYI